MSAHASHSSDRPDLIETLERFGLIKDAAQKEQLLKLAAIMPQPQTRKAKPTRRVNAKLAEELKQLRAVNTAMADHTEMLACALGACPECFGMDVDCTNCAGEGRPGFFLPDELCFQRFVLPVIDRILRDKKSPAQIPQGQLTQTST